MQHPNIFRNDSTFTGSNFSLNDRLYNDMEVEILLIDLEKQKKAEADYFSNRDSCYSQIKSAKRDPQVTNTMQRLISERDFIYNQEQAFFRELNDLQILYLKKKQIEADGSRPPHDLNQKIRELLLENKKEKNRLEEQKHNFRTKFEQARMNSQNYAGNQVLSVARNVLNPQLELEKSINGLNSRIEKIEKLKNDHRKTLLNDYLPEDTKLDSDARGAPMQNLINSKLNEILDDKNKESRLGNLSALRASMEILNSKFSFIKDQRGNSFNKPIISLQGVGVDSGPDLQSIQNSRMQNIINKLPGAAGQLPGDQIDQMMKKQQLQQFFKKSIFFIKRNWFL